MSYPANDLPMVSCIMPTYGRVPDLLHLLEEAVYSFLMQSYPNKELIILNDCNGQILECDAPGVYMINSPGRHDTIGDKRNAMVTTAIGTLIAPWDDDDISLPWRLSLSVLKLGSADYFNPKSYWFLNGDKLQYEQRTGYAHNCSLFRRGAWEMVGKYPSSNKDDALMDAKLSKECRTVYGPLSMGEGTYIYRWGVSPHISGNPDVDAGYAALGEREWKPGVYRIIPRWRVDYVKLVHDKIRGLVLAGQSATRGV
jgi:glycosyltransferase involved in cell wall biosynthesis